jgi:DNA-binding winged helix-turn-helix (wHTH) protein
MHCSSVSFGPFRLFPATRVLEKDGQPLALGNRALDILIVLVEKAGEVVNHRELLARVWRGLVVSPANLRVHMNVLRKALNGPSGETRYIANVTGQGYCFVAPIQRDDHPVLQYRLGVVRYQASTPEPLCTLLLLGNPPQDEHWALLGTRAGVICVT